MRNSPFLSLLLLFHNAHSIIAAKSCTTQLGSTSTSPVPTYTTAFTVTTTLTEYLTTVTKTKSKGTTTISTSPGFTPILSENAGAPDVVAAVSPGRNAVTASYPATVFCTTTTTRTVTKQITDSHKVAASTVIITTTTTVPAATTYAACGYAFSPYSISPPPFFPPLLPIFNKGRSVAKSKNWSRSDNIVDQGIGPPGTGHAIEIVSEGNGSFTRILNNNVTTPYDCCVLCQQTPLCAWGYLQIGFGDSTPLPEPLCVLETNYCEYLSGVR